MTDEPRSRAWILHPELTRNPDRRDGARALEEAVSLVCALPGVEITGSTLVKVSDPRPGYLFGRGKTEELADIFNANEVELVLIDGSVTPVQQRNLEKVWKVKILDRTGLILEIFADRARTREGVLQVELAALSYQRTRLVRAWTHLERQRGGLGFVGGPGETQIEADRRAIDDAIARLKRQLAKVVKTRSLHRASRAKVPFPIIALVGYTNAGKSTLFNRLTGAEVLAKDMLFATLDPTMRSINLPGGSKVILSDTVGFISDLPTHLVSAFRATLEEVLAADLIVHVRDVSHPDSEEQAEDVMRILAEIGVADDAPRIDVFNKIDLLGADARKFWEVQAERNDDQVVMSAVTGEGVEAFQQLAVRMIDGARDIVTLSLKFADGKRRAWLYEQGVVLEEEQRETGSDIKASLTPRQLATFKNL